MFQRFSEDPGHSPLKRFPFNSPQASPRTSTVSITASEKGYLDVHPTWYVVYIRMFIWYLYDYVYIYICIITHIIYNRLFSRPLTQWAHTPQ
jgi:hypothetical protein